MITPNPGIYDDIPEAEYHAWDAAHYSTLKLLSESPEEYVYAETHPRKETAALLLGAAVDCRVLSPALFAKRYVVVPKVDKRTKEGKETWEKFQQEAGLRAMLEQDMAYEVEAMTSAVALHPVAQEFLAGGKSQVALVWQDQETNVACKGRIDVLAGKCIVDLKTTRDLSRFSRDVFSLGYHIQAAMYTDGANALGLGIDQYMIVAVQSHAPHRVTVFDMTMDAIQIGRLQYKRALWTLKNCRERNDWRDSSSPVPILVPRWLMYEEDMEGSYDE